MRLGPLGVPEILIILLVILLIFGAKRLPELGSSLGKGLRTFTTAITGEDEKIGQEGQSDNQAADTFTTAITGEDEKNGQEAQSVSKVADDDRALP